MSATLNRTRAAVVTRAILQIFVRHILDDGVALHQQLTDYLADEFDQMARQTLNEIRSEDE